MPGYSQKDMFLDYISSLYQKYCAVPSELLLLKELAGATWAVSATGKSAEEVELESDGPARDSSDKSVPQGCGTSRRWTNNPRDGLGLAQGSCPACLTYPLKLPE